MGKMGGEKSPDYTNTILLYDIRHYQPPPCAPYNDFRVVSRNIGSLRISVANQHVWRFGVGRIANPTYRWRCFTLIPKDPQYFIPEEILETQRRILVFGNSTMLGALAAVLRTLPLLSVVERRAGETPPALGELLPDVILVDGAEATPEQFSGLMVACAGLHPAILSVDPLTYQLTVLAYPHPATSLTEVARAVGMLSLALSPTVRQPGAE